MAANLPNTASASDATEIEVRPLSVHIGAEIHGVDLREPLTAGQVSAIREALLKWKVVFFRDQSMDHRQHVEFSRQFGDPTPGHVVFGGDEQFPEIYSVAKFRNANAKRGAASIRSWTGWHTDITAAINPPASSILRGVVVPPYGGDTLWTNLAVAYQALSPMLRDFVDNLTGEHRFDSPTGGTGAKAYNDVVSKNSLVSRHPLVRVHPETGERVLYVSPSFLKSIPDLKPAESERIMHLLWEHAVLPEFTVRFKWQPGSVAFWDNRSTAHLAPRDIFDSEFDRQFYRVTLMGDIPKGVNGQASEALEGRPITPV
jgi:alpha-ketoglutarate-dependent taurine dioxygenase